MGSHRSVDPIREEGRRQAEREHPRGCQRRDGYVDYGLPMAAPPEGPAGKEHSARLFPALDR